MLVEKRICCRNKILEDIFFWSENNFGRQKNALVKTKIIVESFFWVNKQILVHKMWSKKKNFWLKKNVVEKKLLVKKMFGPDLSEIENLAYSLKALTPKLSSDLKSVEKWLS